MAAALVVAGSMAGLQPEIFLSRLREAISIDHFQVGMIKAPFMALVIGIVACVEGLAGARQCGIARPCTPPHPW